MMRWMKPPGWVAGFVFACSAAVVSFGAGPAVTVETVSPKYVKATPEQVKTVDDFAKETNAEILQKFHITFVKLETDHFQIYTDWDPREYTFLKNAFEDAYSTVSLQFNIPVKENIFLGKLPCFVFAKFGGFAKFSKVIGGFPGDISPDLQGYYRGSTAGYGYMCVYKPQDQYSGPDVNAKIVFWKYVLTHEMTHAFVARYVSDKRVTTWLNEGIAEVVASSRYSHNIREAVKEADRKYGDLNALFADDSKFRSPDMYPVMETLVQVLVHRNKTAFIKMFGEIKSGEDVEAALEENYHWNYEQLEAAWRQAVRSLP